jgi:quercetin dioxygenase-like cupin family protein
MSEGEAARTSWGSGDPIAGTPFRQLVTTAATDGRLVVLAVDMPPGLRVDEHVHDAEDQITIVISGSVGASLGEQRFSLGDGSVLFLPRGIPHSLWNDGAEPARILEIYTPGGFERIFEQAGQLASAGQPAGSAEYAAALEATRR